MNENNQDQPQQPQSYILIQFAELGSVFMNIKFENVSAGQLLAAAKIIEMKGQSGFIQEENARLEREAEKNIARPSQGILTAHK